jgi:hypothetical protein
MNDTTSIKSHFIPNNRGVDRQTRAARIRAARSHPVGAFPRIAIMIGQWDGGSIVGAFRRAEDAVEVVGKHDALVKQLEDMRDFCTGTEGTRPHPSNVARLCIAVLGVLQPEKHHG